MARNAKNTRMCSGCMSRKQKDELIPVYNTPDGAVVGRNIAHGRTAYLCPDLKCMEKAIKKKCFSRMLRCDIKPGFYDELRNYFASIEE